MLSNSQYTINTFDMVVFILKADIRCKLTVHYENRYTSIYKGMV